MDNAELIDTEIEKCRESFMYFCEKYVKLPNPVFQKVPFRLFDFQKRLIKEIDSNKYLIAKKFRQGGFTSLCISWLIWRFLFKENETNCILGLSTWQNYCVAASIIDNLPDFLKSENISDPHDGFQNKSNNLFFRGDQISQANYVFLDEAAFLHDCESIWENINFNSNIIVISTPRQKNGWFYENYKHAECNYGFFKIFKSDYTERPDFAETDWAKNISLILGENCWRNEYLQEFLD